MKFSQYMFIKDFHSIESAETWDTAEARALLDIFPVLIADIPIGSDAPLFKWLWQSKAIFEIKKAAEADKKRFKLTLETCDIVMELFKQTI